MAKRVTPPWTIAPLQRVVGEPVTDPAEIAAIEKACRRGRASRPLKKATPPFTMAPLQRIVGEPITDPAEIAAFMKARKRAKATQRAKKAKTLRSRAAARKKA